MAAEPQFGPLKKRRLTLLKSCVINAYSSRSCSVASSSLDTYWWFSIDRGALPEKKRLISRFYRGTAMRGHSIRFDEFLVVLPISFFCVLSPASLLFLSSLSFSVFLNISPDMSRQRSKKEGTPPPIHFESCWKRLSVGWVEKQQHCVFCSAP